jgi:hypothetical protein
MGVEILEDTLADFPMQMADSIYPAAGSCRQVGHIEGLIIILPIPAA